MLQPVGFHYKCVVKKELKKHPGLVSLFNSCTKDSNRQDNGKEDADDEGEKLTDFHALRKLMRIH